MHAVVVEDDPGVRSLAARVLERAGFDSLVFSSADDALRHFSRGSWAVDLVLTDVAMPGGIDGLGLARHLGRVRPEIAVIVMSGCPESIGAAREMPSVTAVLAKPFQVAELSTLARAAVGRRPRMGELIAANVRPDHRGVGTEKGAQHE